MVIIYISLKTFIVLYSVKFCYVLLRRWFLKKLVESKKWKREEVEEVNNFIDWF